MITAENAIEALRRLTAEKGPDFVYESPSVTTVEGVEEYTDGDCKYVYEGLPSCAVGYVLIEYYNVPADFFSDFEGKGILPEWNMYLPKNARITRAARVVLTKFQSLQDANHPYGVCLIRAEDTYQRVLASPRVSPDTLS